MDGRLYALFLVVAAGNIVFSGFVSLFMKIS